MIINRPTIFALVLLCSAQMVFASTPEKCQPLLKSFMELEGAFVHAKPTDQALKDIVLLTRFDSILAKCVYPELKVNALGEYVNQDTVTTRTEYLWKGRRYVTNSGERSLTTNESN